MLLPFVAELAMFIIVFYFLLGLDFSTNKVKLCCFGLITVLNCIYRIFQIPYLPSTFVLAIILSLLFNQKTSLIVCLTVTCTLCELIAAYFLFDVIHLLFGANNYDVTFVMLHIDYFLYSTAIIFSLLMGKKHKALKKAIQRLDTKSCRFLFIINFFSLWFLTFAEAFLVTQVPDRSYFLIAVLLILIFTIALFTISAVLILLRHNNLKLKKINYLNQKCLELQKAHYLDVKENDHNLKTFRHNFNSHILALQNLVALKEWDRLEDYITQLSVDKNNISLYNISTGNLIADAIINQFHRSLSDDVQFKINGQFQEECFVEDMDISIILYNLLNNACEALEYIEKNCSKEIYLFISADFGQVTLMVENASKPYTPSELEHLQTSKPDKSNHGFGLSSVREACEKYHGNLSIKFADGFFTAAVILQNK